MKKLIVFLLAGVMALSLAACGGSGGSTTAPAQNAGGDAAPAEGSASGDVIRIGVFEPSTGDSASGGKKETLGMQYANKNTPTVEAGGKTYQVELVYADNGSSSDKAPSAASELIGKDVSLVLGSYGSGVSMAGGPKFEEAGLAAIGVTCTNPNVTAGNDYYFRICFLDNFQADVLANFAMEKFSAKKAYCLGENGNEYDHPTNNSDFTSYLNKAKSEGVDVIFTPVSIAYAKQIMEQAASLSIEIPFLGSDTLDDNMVLEATAGTNLKLYVSTFYQEGGDETFDQGIKEYINSDSTALTNNGGNDTISAVTAMGYDAYYVALEAIKAAGGPDKAAIKGAIGGVTYDGVSGSIAFDAQGDAVRDTAYIKTADTENGTWAFEKVQTGSGN